MTEGSENIWSGDINIFSGERLVARFIGIAVGVLDCSDSTDTDRD